MKIIVRFPHIYESYFILWILSIQWMLQNYPGLSIYHFEHAQFMPVYRCCKLGSKIYFTILLNENISGKNG